MSKISMVVLKINFSVAKLLNVVISISSVLNNMFYRANIVN